MITIRRPSARLVLLPVLALLLSSAARAAELATWKGHDGQVRCVAFSPDGKTAVSGGADRTVRHWDVATGKTLAIWQGHEEPVRAVAFTPDGKKALSASEDRTLKVWDVATGQTLASWAGHEAPVVSVAVSPDGAVAISGDGLGNRLLWEAATGARIPAIWERHKGKVISVAFSPDGKTALSGSSDDSIRICDVNRGARGSTGSCWVYSIAILLSEAERVRLRKTVVQADAIAFSPDGKSALTGGDDGSLVMWNLGSAGERSAFKGHEVGVSAVAFSPDGKLVLSGAGDGVVMLWDVATRQNLAIWQGHKGPVYGLAFSPDGKNVLSGSFDHTVKLWDVGRELGRIEYFNLGKQLVAEKKPAQAREYLERAVESQPQDNEYRNWLASVYCDLGDYQKALKQHQEISAIRPADIWSYYYGTALMKTGRLDDGRDALTKALNEGPERSRGTDRGGEIRLLLEKLETHRKLLARAELHLGEGKLREAQKELREAVNALETPEARNKLDDLTRQLIGRKKKMKRNLGLGAAAAAIVVLVGAGAKREREKKARQAQLAAQIKARLAEVTGGPATAVSLVEKAAAAKGPVNWDEVRGLFAQYKKEGGNPAEFTQPQLALIEMGPPKPAPAQAPPPPGPTPPI